MCSQRALRSRFRAAKFLFASLSKNQAALERDAAKGHCDIWVSGSHPEFGGLLLWLPPNPQTLRSGPQPPKEGEQEIALYFGKMYRSYLKTIGYGVLPL